ncbi:MAG: hypothetical protein WC044_03755 [Crocinitomicaceae bacterium]
MKLGLVLAFLLTSVFSHSQENTKYKNQTIEVLGTEVYNNLESNNPGLLHLLESYLKTGFEIKKFESRFKNAVIIESIPLRKKGEFMTVQAFIDLVENGSTNVLTFAFIPSQKEQIFQLSETGYYLVIPSQKSML